MLLSDLPEVSVEVHVEAPPETVWPFVVDVNTPARYSSEFQRAEWLDDGVPAVGARFRGHNQRGEIEWSTTCTVTAFEPVREFVWVVDALELPVATWSFLLTPERGGTRLNMRAKLGPGRSGLTMAVEARPEKEERIVAGRMEEWRLNMVDTVEGIRDLAEE